METGRRKRPVFYTKISWSGDVYLFMNILQMSHEIDIIFYIFQ